MVKTILQAEILNGAELLKKLLFYLLISSACPAIVKMIQVRFPGLIDNLVPIEAPLVTALELTRAY